MTKQTSTHKAQPYFSAQWVYDELMSRIEPDLVSNHISLLEKKYAGETKEQRKDRMEHYVVAFFIFEECMKDLQIAMEEDVRAWKKQMAHVSKGETVKNEHASMRSIEQQIDSSDS